MFQQQNFNQFKKTDHKRYASVIFFILLAVATIYGGSRVGSNEIEISTEMDETLWNRVANIFTISSEKKITIENDPEYVMPKPEDDRWDLLVLGIRGEDGEESDQTGRLLTDTIILISYDKKTSKTSMVSIPRDLYLRVYGDKISKVNEIYEAGGRNPLSFTKKVFSRITGVYIDSAVVVDFSSFKKVIDDLGGIDVVLDRPFSETQQWGYEFHLPAGTNHLDGQNALYYARSRFSSSDFDRAQRQQKVLIAIKDKITELNLLADPIKTLSILNTIRSNIETDLNIWDVGSLLKLSEQFSGADEKVNKYVMTTENILYETHVQTEVGNLYVLKPNGDNLQQIKHLFQDILK